MFVVFVVLFLALEILLGVLYAVWVRADAAVVAELSS